MARLIGYFSDKTVDAPTVLRMAGQRARTPTNGERLAFGIGYYQGAEILRRRKPKPVGDVDLVEAAEGLCTSALISHVHKGDGAPKKINDLQPFSFGAWTFGLMGTLPGGEILRDAICADLPDSVQRGAHGNTGAEVFFLLFLARLADEGISPRSWQVEGEKVAMALRNTVTHWQYAARAQAHDDREIAVGILATNGQTFFAMARGVRLQCLPLRLAGSVAVVQGLDKNRGLASPGAFLFLEEPEPRADDQFEAIGQNTIAWVDSSLTLHRNEP